MNVNDESLNPLHCGAVVASAPRRTAGGQGGTRLNPLHCGAVVASGPRCGRGSPAFLRLNPLHCGAVVASKAFPPRRGGRSVSQSPSLRGSGRFRLPQAGGVSEKNGVSIPFIAGQWSLRAKRLEQQIESLGLNPLHCGAVVASSARKGRGASAEGSLNPLHCGAVVASCARCRPPPAAGRRVSIPFIAGQWSLPHPPTYEALGDNVSIPFIAGQWSLPRGVNFPTGTRPCLNPLHCGAVVASIHSNPHYA